MMSGGFAVWLYGSHARGDRDSHSDIDIFVVGAPYVSLADIQGSIPIPMNTAAPSRYSWGEISEMAKYGSLFLHHLRLEGLPLYESPSCKGKLGSLLMSLCDYQCVDRDLNGFHTVLDDVGDALGDHGTENFELSVLGTVVRHCSILGCWVLGEPSFGRTKPVDRIVSALGLPVCIAKEFPSLYGYRLYVDGRIPKPFLIYRLQPHEWLLRARSLVAKVEELTHERYH